MSGRQPDEAGPAEPRIRFTETEFNPPALMPGFAAEKEIAKQSAQFYQVHPDTGRLTLRSAKLAEAMADRQYSAIGDDHVLAAMPGAGGYRYVFVARDRSGARVLAGGVDDLQGDPDAVRLWAALHRRFDLGPVARMAAGTGR